LTWQIARQLVSATVGHQLVGSSGEFLAFYASSARKSSESVATSGGRLGPHAFGLTMSTQSTYSPFPAVVKGIELSY